MEVTNFNDESVFLVQDGVVMIEGYEDTVLTGGDGYLETLETVYGYTPPSAGTIVIPSERTGFIAPEDAASAVIETADVPEDAVRTTLRMTGNVEDFESGGGEEAFIAALAESLGIDPSQITIQGVY